MVRNVKKMTFLTKTDFFKCIFLKKNFDAILQDVSAAETIGTTIETNGKLLIFILLSFNVPKIMVVRHV